MHVLNLVTNASAPFYRTQVRAVERAGIEETTLPVPGRRETTDDGDDHRSPLDYLRFYPQVLRHGAAGRLPLGGDGYDLVHANYGLTAPAALAQPTRPVVLTLWGSDLLGELEPVSRWCARLADAVVVMTDDMADRLPVEAHVVPHGVDRDLFQPMPQDPARDAVGWAREPHQVLFPYATGRPVKDFPRAERVVDAARSRLDRPVELQTLSGVSHRRMPLYHNAADALLLTSRSEGSPNSVKEALACDTPVVATDVGDVRERLAGVEPSAVAASDAGLVDALVDTLERGPPSNGRAAVAELGVERMGERLRSVYETALAARE